MKFFKFFLKRYPYQKKEKEEGKAEKEKEKENKKEFEENDPSIAMITIEELNKLLFSPLQEVNIEKSLSEEENQKILKEIINTYSNFPEEVKRLFRYKTLAIYYLPFETNFSGLTLFSKLSDEKAIIVLTAKALQRGITITLLHELGHCLDFNTYPPMHTPKWAWDFIDKFEKDILVKEPEPVEGIDRDIDRYLFGERKEEWASRLAATILTLYFTSISKESDLSVTGLRKPPLTADEFKRLYPLSFNFFKRFLENLFREEL